MSLLCYVGLRARRALIHVRYAAVRVVSPHLFVQYFCLMEEIILKTTKKSKIDTPQI